MLECVPGPACLRSVWVVAEVWRWSCSAPPSSEEELSLDTPDLGTLACWGSIIAMYILYIRC